MTQALRDSAETLTNPSDHPEGSATQAAGRPLERVDVSADASSGHGDVRVTVRNARLTRCVITDSALTLDADAIGDLVCEAVNSAMADYETATIKAFQEQQGTDMAEVQRQLDAASREAERGMQEYLDQLRALVDKTKNRTSHTPKNP